MSNSAEFDRAFEHARQLHAAGQFEAAEQAYRELAANSQNREPVLRSLVELYMQTRRTREVVETLVQLTEVVPDKLYYFARLAALMDGLGRTDQAIYHYQRFLQLQPGHATAWFNVALLYKKGKLYQEALNAYATAINNGIDNMQEVYTNIGVIHAEMRRPDNAEQNYRKALEIDSGYIPALFNLAGLYEERGKRDTAQDIYGQILALQPGHADTLVRLANAAKPAGNDDPLLDELKQAAESGTTEPLARAGLLFALGKLHDDLENYEEAFSTYRRANDIGRQQRAVYDTGAVEQAFAGLCDVFGREQIKRLQTASEEAPVFICGMFRSGTSLVEQILAAHPRVTAGGELDYLPLLLAEHLSPWPDQVLNTTGDTIRLLSSEYLRRIRLQFPGADMITDKRPDNFLHLGIIMTMFPGARIVYTRRNPMDNCLSVFFQQLGGNLAYANSLEDTAHYYGEHVKLMQHWHDCFAENILTVDYDELVRTPEPVLRRLFDFLGLDWDDDIMNFHESGNLVQTASVWQVRRELHTDSSGRWRNYAHFAPELERLLASYI